MAKTRNMSDAQIDGRVDRILAGYRPLPGIFDEMVARSGEIRPHWQPFLSMLAELGPETIQRRFAAADRHLRDSGVFYRVYEDPAGAERPWPFSHVPLIIDAADWKTLKAGLVQRADLLEAVLGDVYGPAKLVNDGRLPAVLVAGNPEFLRPLVGVAPQGDAHIRFYAVDVGRSANGQWWVLGDRTQAPSGAGYALENRLALARGIPDIYRTLRVQRLAPFFQAFQSALESLNRQDDSRVCLLTPGPMNEIYFEHAFLARYLGFLLVEGEDLTVRDDGVFIRTVSGLRRAEVLLRRLDADFVDPLELNAKSRLGVPGLVQAAREGKVAIANALGAGFAEARALLSFLPALAPVVLGSELRLPNVATWWLGQTHVRDVMIRQLDRMVIAPAFGADAGGEFLGSGVLGASLDDARCTRIAAAIKDRGLDFVVQETVNLSTTPVWVDGRLEPRPFILRVYVARTAEGWSVMPGGFVRVADDMDSRAVSLQHGGRTADAWVLADGPVGETTLLPSPETISIKRATGMLPSRAAENLFWLGRYVERAEATLRLVRALLNRFSEADEATGSALERITSLLGAWSAGPIDIPYTKVTLIARAALQRNDCEGSLPRLVGSARAAASVIRDRLSPDAWRALTTLGDIFAEPATAGVSDGDMFERVDAALHILSSFSGLAQENMTQLGGWRFLELGRRIERAVATCRFARQFAHEPSMDEALDVMLELCDSRITYRQRYLMVAARAPVIDLVVLDPSNPRSVAYQVDLIETHLAALARRNADGRLTPPQQVAAAMATTLRTTDASAIDNDAIYGIENALLKLSEAVSAAYLTHSQRSETAWETLA